MAARSPMPWRRWLAGAVLPLALLGTPPLRAAPAPPASPDPGQPAPQPPRAGTTAEQLYLEGLRQSNAQQLPAAIQAWEQALLLFRQRADAAGEARTLEELGFAHYWLERYEPALAFFRQALTLHRRLGDRTREAIVLGRIGDVLAYQDRPAEALAASQASLNLLGREARADPATLLRLHMRIAWLHADQQGDPLALRHFHDALRLAEKLDDPETALTIRTAIGAIQLRLARYDAAIATLQPVLVQMEARRSPPGERAHVLQQIGFSHYWRNDYAEAIDAYVRGLALAREAGDTRNQLTLLRGLADVHVFVGNNEASRGFSREALELARTSGDRLSEAVALIALGGFAAEDGDTATAVAQLERGLALARAGKNRNLEANALSALGHAQAERGDGGASRRAYAQSLAIYREIGNRYNEGMMLLALGHGDLRQNQTDRASLSYRQALTIYEAIDDRYGQAQALVGLGLAMHRAGRNQEAEEPLRQAVARNEEIRARLGPRDDLKVSLFDTQTSPYQALQVVLVAQGRSEDALVVAERARARAFVEQLQARSVAAGSAQTPAATATAAAAPMDLAAIRAVARSQNATMVQYALINDRIYTWVVAPDGRISFRRLQSPGSLASLDRLVVASREAMGVRSARGLAVVAAATPAAARRSGASDGALADLHRLLIQPIADLLPADPEAPVIVIPQGPLFFVPFPALRDATGQPLIARHTLLTAPSIEVLAMLSRGRDSRPRGDGGRGESGQGEGGRDGGGRGVLVAGNPTMPAIALRPGDPPVPLAPLPGAEQEARAIAALFGTTPLIGARATETAVVAGMGQARLVHLATHGLLDDDMRQQVPGAIVLAASDRDDGLLTAGEILGLSLSADLFVLSACDTGRGTITGDGVIGLSRSLLTAGARSVLVSLWAVPDAPTTALMTAFYRELAAGRSKARALRAAMLEVRRQEPDPVAWAAFTLIGDTD